MHSGVLMGAIVWKVSVDGCGKSNPIRRAAPNRIIFRVRLKSPDRRCFWWQPQLPILQLHSFLWLHSIPVNPIHPKSMSNLGQVAEANCLPRLHPRRRHHNPNYPHQHHYDGTNSYQFNQCLGSVCSYHHRSPHLTCLLFLTILIPSD